MIQQEIITIGDKQLRKTYSDSNKMILQIETGIEYSEAVDVLESTFTYEESENEIQ